MKIEMLSTGDEVLQGDIVDSNAAWLGQFLVDRGLKFSRRQTVADEMDDIIEALDVASARADWVIVNGGLGPTSDDLSAEAAARLQGRELVLYQEWLDKLQQWNDAQNKPMPQSNLKQAMLPEGASLVDNAIGTACGFIIEHRGAKLLFTPGVPSEFKQMIEQQWWPLLEDSLQSQQNLAIKRLYTFGLSESGISDRLQSLSLPQGFKLGFRSARPSIEIKLFGDAEHPQWDELVELLRDEFDQHVFSEDQGNWAAKLQQLMLEQSKQLALAESCTGGMLAAELVGVSGSSAYLNRAYVTYSNQAKQDDLGVSENVLAEHGAVSMATAQAMAQGALARSGADIALSITGIAGPGGGSEEKPVGTVCFALASKEEVYVQQVLIANRNRHAVRVVAKAIAMDMLRRHLQGQTVLASYEHIQSKARQHILLN